MWLQAYTERNASHIAYTFRIAINSTTAQEVCVRDVSLLNYMSNFCLTFICEMQSRVFIIYSTLQRIDVEYSFDFLPSHTKLPQKSDGENGGAGVCHCHGRRRRAAKQRAYTSTPPNVHIWACRRFRSTKYTRDRKYSHCVAYIIKTLSIYIYAHRCKCMRTQISQFIIVRSGSALLSCWADSLVRLGGSRNHTIHADSLANS